MNPKTYQTVVVEPYEMESVRDMRIVKKPNEHTTLVLTGVLTDEAKDSYIHDAVAKKTVEVKVAPVGGETPRVIFSGVIKNMELKASAGVYYLTIEAVSHSKKLDVEYVRRSYQKLGTPYKTLIQSAVENYGGETMDKSSNGKTADEFILQYNETPWRFIMRMASRWNAPLIVEDLLDRPKVYLGIPDKDEIGKLEDFIYTVQKGTAAYRTSVENFKESAFESDYIHYAIFSEEIFEIANKVKFKERTFYVNEALIQMENGIFSNVYKLTDKSGFHQNLIKNPDMVGISIEGRVVDVARDEVKIFLDIDEEYPPEEFCWFKYATPYTSDNGGGFYCMPELGEKVRLYMPDANDERAYSTNCVRTRFDVNETRGIPDIKYWRTAAGKEIMMTPSGMLISCVDSQIFIKLIDDEGILVQSSKNIGIIANEGAGINISAEGKIVLAAEEEFDVFCNGGSLNMKDGIMKIRGVNVLEN